METIDEVSGLKGYFAPLVQARAEAPAVILLPAIAGLNDYITRVGVRLNAAGFAVLAIDYFDAGPPDLSSPEKIGAAVAGVSDVRVMETINRARDYLQRRREVHGHRIATLGFCIGGTFALLAAAQVEGLAASAAYYGGLRYAATSATKPLAPLDAVSEMRIPLLCHFGTNDNFVAAKDVDSFEALLASSGKTYELFRYPGAPHAFDEDFRASFRPVAAQEAWSRTLTFLNWHIGGSGREG